MLVCVCEGVKGWACDSVEWGRESCFGHSETLQESIHLLLDLLCHPSGLPNLQSLRSENEKNKPYDYSETKYM